jgi:threonine/homoserine/homoserine lactone efflux protein
MVDWTLWAGFVVASLIVGLLLGPGVTSIVGYALTAGMRTALASVFGATAGNATAMALSLVGVGVLIEQYPAAFFILKWVGAAYLVAIGLYAIVTAKPAREDGSPPKTIRPATAFWGTLAVTAVNPKTIIFFVAFTPQFMSPALDYWTQAGVLLVTFSVVVTLSDGFYAVAASWVAGFLKGPNVFLWSQRVGGVVLMGAGIATATMSA